jgi:alpha-tubulin suppressor-like RCC1 family protein
MRWRGLVALSLAVVAACGPNDTSGLPTVPTLDEQGADGFAAVSVGLDHTCALSTAGRAYCWGSDGQLQLGHPPGNRCDTTALGACSLAAAPVSTNLVFTAISAGAVGTCALTADAAAYCWGTNTGGVLGIAGDAAASPAPVLGGLRFSAISVGYSHSCGVAVGGSAYCWGANDRGQLGTGDTSSRAVPTPVSTNEKFVEVSAGQGRTCGRTANNTVLCWGAVWLYRSGGLEYTHSQPLPAAVPAAPPLAGLSVGSFTTCGVADSTAYCWEANPHGEIGDGTTDGSTMPVRVAGGLRFTSVSAGVIQTCGLTAEGDAYCWGNDTFGQLGVSPGALSSRCGAQNLPCSLTPVRVIGWRKFTRVSTGFGNHACGVTDDTNIYCWGLAQSGQLGYGGRIGATSQPLRVAIALP